MKLKFLAASVRFLIIAVILGMVILLDEREEKSGGSSLQETVLLSQKVKRFEKMLSISPGQSLTKSTNEQVASSIISIYLQRKCTLALHEPFDAEIQAHFALSGEKTPLQKLAITTQDNSVYVQRLNTFSDLRSVITPDFARKTTLQKVKSIIHEDLHDEFNLPLEQEEALITPLAYLAAREFFQSTGDKQYVKDSEKKIADARAMSREINAFVKYMETVFKRLPCDEAQKKVYRHLVTLRHYQNMYQKDTAGQKDTLEAKANYDFNYWKYFDTIISLHELGVSLKTLIVDLKKSPHTYPEITQYFRKLEERYRKQYNR